MNPESTAILKTKQVTMQTFMLKGWVIFWEGIIHD